MLHMQNLCILIVLLLAVTSVSASDCDSITSQASCASASCAWCTSGAVGDSCVSPEDAAALPSAVFSCSTGAAVENYHFMATSSCESVSAEDKCTSTSGCSWCDSAAVGSSCMSSSDASALPAAVFTCKDASVKSKKPLFSGVGAWFDAEPSVAKPNTLKALFAAPTCESMTDSKGCMGTSEGKDHCAWCTSGAVGNSCVPAADAQDLPSAVFECNYGFASFSDEPAVSAVAPVVAETVSSSGTFGVDISQALSSSTASCFAQNSVSYVVARGYRSSGSVDPNMCASLTSAKAAGISGRHAYMFPDPKSSKSAATQMSELKSTINSCSAFSGKVWLDIEGSQYWLGSSSANQAWYSQLVGACKSSGLSCGIYTSANNWQTIFGSSTWVGNNGLPLWYAHYDNSQSFSDFKAFGGWSTPTAKQYQGDTTLCSFGVDKNYGSI